MDTACQATMSDTSVLAFHATGASLRDCSRFFLSLGLFGLSVGQSPSLRLSLSLSLSFSSLFRTYCMQDVRHGIECHKGRCSYTLADWTKRQNWTILKVLCSRHFREEKLCEGTLCDKFVREQFANGVGVGSLCAFSLGSLTGFLMGIYIRYIVLGSAGHKVSRTDSIGFGQLF